MIIVKVGGSLFDLPDLRQRLGRFLATLNEEVIIVPGGGAAADAVRDWDRVHQIGEEASHWLAVKAMDHAGGFLRELTDVAILNVETFLREHDTLPHTWSVTSDSIAAHVAITMHAASLILLKSTNDGDDLVDDLFPTIASRLKCSVRVVNLREFVASPPVATGGL